MDDLSKYMSFLPSLALRPFVSEYWLGLYNPLSSYLALPDGSVDLVIEFNEVDTKSLLYGTTTKPSDIIISPQQHYIGIRFQPGQSRHFINLPSKELTDAFELSDGILDFSLEGFTEQLAFEQIISQLDSLLKTHLSHKQPERGRIDNVITMIQSTHGLVKIDEVAALYGKSRRQFERTFLDTVGITPKFFSLITRFQNASTLITQLSHSSLADIASDAGYSDQSHMNHDFKRMTGFSPTQFIREYDAFLQYTKKN